MRRVLLSCPSLYTTEKNKSAGCFILFTSLYEKEMNDFAYKLILQGGKINEKETPA